MICEPLVSPATDLEVSSRETEILGLYREVRPNEIVLSRTPASTATAEVWRCIRQNSDLLGRTGDYMQLVAFSVTNYRSITKASKLPFRQKTVLIGPNNEGKSNILRALVTALEFLGW